MDRKRDIIKKLNAMSGSRSPYEVFCDWVELMALSIQNSCQVLHGPVWQKREETYKQLIKPYGESGREFVELFGMLVETLDTEMTDALGDIYMLGGMGNKNTGQFFTPFHLSLACAKMTVPKIPDGEHWALNEPSCGGGGMIIAAARALKEQGENYQRKMRVVAQDLDWKAVYMCYVQLSLLGIDAMVVQGNTLAEPWTPYSDTPPERVWYTPERMGVLL